VQTRQGWAGLGVSAAVEVALGHKSKQAPLQQQGCAEMRNEERIKRSTQPPAINYDTHSLPVLQRQVCACAIHASLRAPRAHSPTKASPGMLLGCDMHARRHTAVRRRRDAAAGLAHAGLAHTHTTPLHKEPGHVRMHAGWGRPPAYGGPKASEQTSLPWRRWRRAWGACCSGASWRWLRACGPPHPRAPQSPSCRPRPVCVIAPPPACKHAS